jgi:hypothetical protein
MRQRAKTWNYPRFLNLNQINEKMHNPLFPCLFIIQLASCSPSGKDVAQSLVNPAHLDHLYEEIQIDNTRLGAIWIYCEAPDYHLVDDDDEGFTCVDDVARALVFYCRHYRSDSSKEVLDKIRSLTEFLLYMQAENGFFYNFMLPDKQINKTHQNSRAVAAFWTWRAFWGLSELNLLEADELKDLQSRSRLAMHMVIVKMEELCASPADTAVFEGVAIPKCIADLGADQAGVMMIGLTNYYRLHPSEKIRELLLFFGNLLLDTQQGDADTPPHYAFLSWQNYWHAWGNSQAHGLLYAGRILQHEPFIQAGLNEARHFYPYVLEKGFIHGFRLVKEGDSLIMQDYRQFPQIAYDIRPMVFASLEAFAATGDTTFVDKARRLAAWLSGGNPAGRPMYDPATGRTFDGIGSPEEVNRNSGAESTIEGLLILQAVEMW